MVPSDFEGSGRIYSMTGYGEGTGSLEGRKIEANVRTLNHDNTSVKVRGLREDQGLTHKVENYVRESFPRGRIEVRIEVEEGEGLAPAELDSEAIRKSFASLSQLAEDLGIPEGPDLGDLISLDLLETTPLYKGSWPTIKDALSQAIEEALEAQEKEGRSIREDMLDHLDEISRQLEEAEEDVPEVVRQYKRELEARIDKLLEERVEPDEEKLEQEVASFADRVDVNEEISRAKSHIETAKETLKEGGLVGKKLEFIRQELQREINTLGAKSKDSKIQSEVIEMKLALEKFKEQSRNLA
ncbi:YicC family protein [Candidatus Bipolaricaulota bacterium]|nr:YicC family protein [Candidatus Bipolaricaulota bacterium]